MFNVIRIPTKFSKTIRRLSDKEKSQLFNLLIDIGDGLNVNVPDSIVGDIFSLIYGEWMNMESRNGNKPKESLIQYVPEGPGTSYPSDTGHRVEYSRVEESIIDNSTNVELKQALEITEKKEYGDPNINMMLDGLKKAVGVRTFKETDKMQRIYGKHFCNLMTDIGSEEFKKRLKEILSDPFKRKNSNSLKYLYAEMKAFISDEGVPVQSKTKIGIAMA